MNHIEVEQQPIYLGCIEEEGALKKFILCTETSTGQCLNLENLTIYPKLDYKVERGVIHYPKMTLMKIINLSYLLKLLNYPKVDELAEQLTTTRLEMLMKKDTETLDLHQLNYLKKIYSLLQMNELEEKTLKVSSKIKKYLYK